MNRIGKEFFSRHTVKVAQDLLGKLFILNFPDHPKRVVRIIETEAYRADDPASHSARGKTPRCSPMFEEGGILYVYFIYGMYEMLNFVTEPSDQPGAVLIRGVEAVSGFGNHSPRMTGPGLLTRELGITREHNRASLFGSRFRIEDDPNCPPFKILKTSRIGIREGLEKKWRFVMDRKIAGGKR